MVADIAAAVTTATPSDAFNNMINVWNAYQCFITFIWSRAASFVYCGLRNGYGYRDTVQDIQGIIHLDPELAADKIRFMLSAQVDNGGGLPLVKFDHNAGHENTPDDPEYVKETGHPSYRADDALWLFPTIRKYVGESGNKAFYDEVIVYANGGEDTVYDHLKRAIRFSMERLGDHNMPAGLHADRTDASVAQVRAMFEDAGVRTVEIDNDTHEAAGEAPADIRQDGGMKQVLEAGYRKTLGTMRNLVSTTANTTQTAFLQACDRAYMQVSSGAFSYQDAIRMAVRDLADGGAYITYPTGHRDRIDVAVRRCVLTGVGQTAAAVAKKRAEDSGCQYMELTAHGGARPEHARWQGQLVQIQGKRTRKVIDGLKVFTLEEIGYGDGRGFKGWNCRHNWHPYYPGLSVGIEN